MRSCPWYLWNHFKKNLFSETNKWSLQNHVRTAVERSHSWRCLWWVDCLALTCRRTTSRYPLHDSPHQRFWLLTMVLWVARAVPWGRNKTVVFVSMSLILGDAGHVLPWCTMGQEHTLRKWPVSPTHPLPGHTCSACSPHAFCEIWHKSRLSCNLLSFLLVTKNVICHSLKCPNIYSSHNSFLGGFLVPLHHGIQWLTLHC